MIRSALYSVAVLAALAVARLLPEHGPWLFLRLGATTLAVLLPGWLIARAFGHGSASATLVWTLGALTLALSIVFAVRSSFDVALFVLAALGVVAIVFTRGEPPESEVGGEAIVAAAGIALGVALWHVMPHVLTGDSPFHAARVRKLVELGSLTPWRLDELAGGGLHPGYAFPLWHAFLAAVAKLSGVDTSLVMRYESALLVPLAVLVAY